MASNKRQNFLIEEPVNKDKKSPKKIFIDIVGIFIVLSLIIGTFLVIKNHEKIIASLPISTDEDGKLVLGRKKNTTYTRSKKLENPDSANSSAVRTSYLDVEIRNFKVTDNEDGFTFTFVAKSRREDLENKIICEKMTVDGFEISNTFELEVPPGEEAKINLKIDKTELDPYEITKPNLITFFIYEEASQKLNSKPERVKVNIIYYASMDNSLQNLATIGTEADTTVSFYKQEEDLENTYLYFDAKNEANKNLTFIKIKKLLINDELYEEADINIDVYYFTEKLFYIKIPRKEIPNIKKFTISFFIISGTESKTQQVYITNEYNHNE